MAKNANGKITQIIGAVVDVEFDGDLPPILTALEVDNNGQRLCWKWPSTSVNKARCIAMDQPKVLSAAWMQKIQAHRSLSLSDLKPLAVFSTSLVSLLMKASR